MKTPLTQLQEDLINMNANNIKEKDVFLLIEYYKSLEEIQLQNMYKLGVLARKDSFEFKDSDFKCKSSQEVFNDLYK